MPTRRMVVNSPKVKSSRLQVESHTCCQRSADERLRPLSSSTCLTQMTWKPTKVYDVSLSSEYASGHVGELTLCSRQEEGKRQLLRSNPTIGDIKQCYDPSDPFARWLHGMSASNCTVGGEISLRHAMPCVILANDCARQGRCCPYLTDRSIRILMRTFYLPL